MSEQGILTHDQFHKLNDIPFSIWDVIGPEHFVLAYVGAILYYLDRLHDAWKREDFEGKIFLKMNAISMITSLITTPIIIIMLLDESVKSFVSLQINYVTAPFVGYFSTYIWKWLVKKAKRVIKKKTKEIDAKG